MHKPKDPMDYFGFLGKGGERGTAFVNRIGRNAHEKQRVIDLRNRSEKI